MQRVHLNSSLLSSVAYDAEGRTLHVWLRDKRHLVHHDISEAVYDNLVSAESAGFYYTCYIAPTGSKGRRTGTRTVIKLVAACLISMLLVSISATAIVGLS